MHHAWTHMIETTRRQVEQLSSTSFSDDSIDYLIWFSFCMHTLHKFIYTIVYVSRIRHIYILIYYQENSVILPKKKKKKFSEISIVLTFERKLISDKQVWQLE